MPCKSQNRQPSLFDAAAPRVKLCPTRRNELTNLLEALLREIAAALVSARSGESSDEQDHR
jgi:hypothetical protein